MERKGKRGRRREAEREGEKRESSYLFRRGTRRERAHRLEEAGDQLASAKGGVEVEWVGLVFKGTGYLGVRPGQQIITPLMLSLFMKRLWSMEY